MEPTAILTNELKNAPALKQVVLYQSNGFWFDALTTLAEQRRLNPNDSTLTTEWANLLKSEGLDAIVQEPLVGSLAGGES